MHTFWRRCAFGGTYLHLHFDCKAHILEDVSAFGRSHLYLHFSCNTHLFLEEMHTKVQLYTHVYRGNDPNEILL